MIVLWTGAHRIGRGVYFVPHVLFENKFSLSSLTFLSLGSHSLSHMFTTQTQEHLKVFITSSSPVRIRSFSGGGAATGAAAPPPKKKNCNIPTPNLPN
jgi:uncharacterized pyridoxamine 5'-phosphate oxidase family protein